MLKIVAGKYRSRMIETPEVGTVPTKNRVREAMLSALCMDIPGARVLDLFAGSGALGIETLSRGASHCDFVDVSPKTVEIIRRNLATLKETNGEVFCLDYKEALARAKYKYDIVFLDPPYAMKESYQEAVDLLRKNELLNEHTTLVLEFEGEIPFDLSPFGDVRKKNYGLTNVYIIRL